MYNEEQKTNFVRYYTTSIATARACNELFNATEAFEQKWDADLCTKSKEELQPMVESLIGFRTHNKSMRFIILKDYVKWCITTGVQGACDGMFDVNPTGLEKVRQQTVASPKHLQKYLDDICDEESMKTTDNIYRCYYWLAYIGVPEDDILSIKCSDVDFSTMSIRYNGAEYPLYREAIPAFKNCVELTEFVYNHPNYTKTVWKPRVDGDTLIRGVRALLSLKSLRVEISRRAKLNEDKTGIRLSYYRVWISGVFYRAYQDELIGEPVDFRAIAAEHMSGKTYKLESGRNTPDAKKRQLARDYLEDYQRWKLAFKI